MGMQDSTGEAGSNDLEPCPDKPRPSFARWCQYIKALYLIGEETLFEEAWNGISNYSPNERLAADAVSSWLETSTHAFHFFSSRDNFVSAMAYADEILTEHYGHIEARFYRVQGAIKSRSWEKALSDIQMLEEAFGAAFDPENPSRQSRAVRAWQWLAQRQLNKIDDPEPPTWLIDPQTLAIFLFENRAPTLPTKEKSEGAELLRLLIEAETVDRCHGGPVSSKTLVRCQHQWPQHLWLRLGLEPFRKSESLSLKKLAERTVHLI